MKMKTIVKHIQFRFYFIDYSYKSSRNKERFGVNASCMLYSLKIVFTMRQGLLTSAVSVLMTTFNAIQANIAVHWKCLKTSKTPFLEHLRFPKNFL